MNNFQIQLENLQEEIQEEAIISGIILGTKLFILLIGLLLASSVLLNIANAFNAIISPIANIFRREKITVELKTASDAIKGDEALMKELKALKSMNIDPNDTKQMAKLIKLQDRVKKKMSPKDLKYLEGVKKKIDK